MITETPRLAPHSLEAEQSVLGTVLLDNSALAKAVEVVVVEDFYRTAHQIIYRAMLELSEAGELIDQITLTERFRMRGELHAVGGSAYIAELWASVSSAANVRAHAIIIRDHAVRRRTIETAQRMQDAAYADAPLAQLAHHATELRLPRVADTPVHAAPCGTTADKGLIRELADMILVTDHFARDAGGQLYVFERGAYRSHGDEHIAKRVKALLVENGDTKHWSSHRAREVSEYLRVDAQALWERPPSTVINLTNGLLDLMAGTLGPHSASHLSCVQLPVAFDPAATCPCWDTFIARVLPEDCRILPYELVAASMRGDVSDQKAVLLVGSGENGKSTLLAGLVEFLGRENVASLPLQRLEIDKFSVVRMLGKLANICADLPSDHLTTTSTFKALTGGDRLTAERKFQGSFEFTAFARLLFSTNHYPQSKDSSHAFFRRWLVVPFDAVIEPQERIPNLSARLANAQELSGVLNQALTVFPAMLARGGFSQNETTRAAAMEFREMTDPLAAWLDRCTTLSPEGMVTKKDLAIVYNSASEAAGRPPMTAKAFCASVRRLRPAIQEGQRRVSGDMKHVFLGLSLIGETTATTDPVSLDSRHSPHSFQISLGVEQKREEEEKKLNRGNGVNGVTEVTVNMDPCFTCDSTRFWRSIHDAVVCASCHPPRNEALVREWIEVEAVRK